MIFKKIEKILTVDGMHCQKCVVRIDAALKGINGVKKVLVDLDKKTVSVISKEEIAESVLKETIEKLGFKVI